MTFMFFLVKSLLISEKKGISHLPTHFSVFSHVVTFVCFTISSMLSPQTAGEEAEGGRGGRGARTEGGQGGPSSGRGFVAWESTLHGTTRENHLVVGKP